MAEHSPASNQSPAALSGGAETGLIHLYRGELGRMTAYRSRLDTTANWALSATTAVVSLTLGSGEIPHLAILAVMVLLLYFVGLEADRFRAYETSRSRVQLLERGFFPSLLAGAADSTWLPRLLEHLNHPSPPLDHWTAVGVRLYRGYRGVYLVLLLSWLLKLELVGTASLDPIRLLARADVSTLPGWVVAVAVLAFYAWLISLTISARRRYPEGDAW